MKYEKSKLQIHAVLTKLYLKCSYVDKGGLIIRHNFDARIEFKSIPSNPPPTELVLWSYCEPALRGQKKANILVASLYSIHNLQNKHDQAVTLITCSACMVPISR